MNKRMRKRKRRKRRTGRKRRERRKGMMWIQFPPLLLLQWPR
jgi:hypothetical protein